MKSEMGSLKTQSSIYCIKITEKNDLILNTYPTEYARQYIFQDIFGGAFKRDGTYQ